MEWKLHRLGKVIQLPARLAEDGGLVYGSIRCNQAVIVQGTKLQ